MNTLKNAKNFIINLLKEKKHILYMALPLISMDIITRTLGKDIDFYKLTGITPNLFTICWIVFFLNLSLNFKKKIGKKIYLITNILFLIIFLINNIYYSTTNTFFGFNLLQSSKEGIPYVLDAIKNSNMIVYISTAIITLLIVNAYKKIPYTTKNNYTTLITLSIWCLIVHIITPISLGKANNEFTWSTWQNLRNNYNTFNDNNKSMQISGLFEYTFRDFYITYLKPKEKQTEEEKEFLNEAFKETGEYNNMYTGIFKDKNLIFIQLEGIDNWLLTKESTPTLYKMMENSYNFSNHFSYYNGGGSTFNSEFAVNTGFISPLSYNQNAYTFNKNNFPNSMAKIFKNEGYTVNAFHMNTGEYYSRKVNYQNWGYDNYYGLIDIKDYNDESYLLDRELILDEHFNSIMFPTDTKFVNYIITYSSHMPFTNESGVCKLLYNIDMGYPKDTTPTLRMNEESCIRRQVRETDYMMKLLLQNLEEKNLIDDTVIIVFTDHYLYTIENKSILEKYKETSNNLINHTPFFIWSKDIIPTTITEVTSQLDILPTTLNLFGLYSNPNNYIGKDALDINYQGIVFFDDYSWYDGNVYVKDGKTNGNIPQENLIEKNNYINYITRKNDLALKFDYFK